jgi:hypothetical protein
MSSKEITPCFFDALRDCPDSCEMHQKSVERHERFVKERNRVFGTKYNSEQVLKEIREPGENPMFIHSYYEGIHAVITNEPGTEKCSKRNDIITSNKK